MQLPFSQLLGNSIRPLGPGQNNGSVTAGGMENAQFYQQ